MNVGASALIDFRNERSRNHVANIQLLKMMSGSNKVGYRKSDLKVQSVDIRTNSNIRFQRRIRT